MIAKLLDFKRVATGFLRDGVWEADLSRLPWWLSIPVRILRVFILMLRGIKDDELLYRASALTFITLVSIVPMLSIAMAVSKGLGYDEYVLGKIAEFGQTQPDNVQKMLSEIINLVESTNFQGLGWIGVAFLILTATMVLNGLEKTLNRIWGIVHHRNMLRRIANYISLLFVVPIFIGVAGTLQGIAMSDKIIPVSVLYNFLIGYMPFISTCVGLALLYVMLPNTRVGWMPALISGLVGAAVWLIWQKAFINLQLSVVKYNAIYGTFASLPIFLIWLHTSWVIILLGAEVGFAVQYHNTLHLERGALDANVHVRELLALSIMADNARIFARGGPVFEKTRYADRHKVPIRLVNDILEVLVENGLLIEVADHENCYALGRSPESIPLRRIVGLIRETGKGIDDFGLEDVERPIAEVLDRIDRGVSGALADQNLDALVD